MRRTINRGPRRIVAKYAGECAETGKAIKRGDDCIYSSGKLYHLESQTADNVRGLEFSRSWGMADQNY